MAQKVRIVGNQNSCFNQFLHQLRDVEIQQDRFRFRHNLQRCAQMLAMELSKDLTYAPQEVTTPLGSLEMMLLQDDLVIVSILRAGLPMHDGFLHVFEKAESGFISAYRHHTRGNEFIVKVEYAAIPDLKGKTLILVDPMIASGQSAVLSYQSIVPEFGTPDRAFVVGIIASEEGLDYVSRKLPEAELFIGAVDGELTGKAYIVPGLGDAGDLAFGDKE